METTEALAICAALAQQTRLEAVRLLVQHEPAGIRAGALSHCLGVPQNTLSAHLKLLAHAGLVRSERRGRMIWYCAEMARVRGLVDFLLRDCCGGNSTACLDNIVFLPSSFAHEEVCP
ncbi:MAG: ArsR/SmtB family transcription factor [Beijerinckiaceae bacterium]